jgi:lysophospholipase L1-like esterase
LAKLLGEGYSVKEEGLSGRTTSFEDPLWEGLNGYAMIYPCLLTHEPVDLLIVMLGTNDVKERFGATPENIAKGMERLVKKAWDTRDAWRKKPRILIVAPPPIEEAYRESDVAGEMGERCAEKSRRLAPLFEQVAGLENCDFLDAGSIPGMKMYPYDSMHLSPESHRLLAEKLATVIPTYFESHVN